MKNKKMLARQLIQQLDELGESHSEVALEAGFGRLIYSWQKFKLKNLENLLEQSDATGFICVNEDERGHVQSTAWALSGMDKVGDMQFLLGLIPDVWTAWEDDHRENDEKVNEKLEFCSQCGAPPLPRRTPNSLRLKAVLESELALRKRSRKS